MLLEREGLLASMAERLEAAASGDGSLVLVAGEAGAGKTSLLRAFIDSIDQSTLVIQGACDPLTTPRPLGPLHDFAIEPEAGLAGLTAGDRSPIDMFAEVLDRLRNSIRPVLVTVEDVHWADEGTLDFLRFIGRRIGESKAMMLCTYRDDEVGVNHPLRSVLGQLIPLESTFRETVPLLSQTAVTELARDETVDPVELARITGGNPFFVTEVLQTGAEIPKTVQDAVIARLATLDSGARRAVEAVSIAPRMLEIDKTTALVATDHESIDHAVGSGMLVSEGPNLRFRHEIARAAIEESIPPARRLQMHRQMIGLLQEDDVRDPARLAHHATRSQDPRSIVEFAPEAGDQAVTHGSRREAAAFYQAALQYPELLGPDRTTDLRVKLAGELRLLDRPDEAVHQLRTAVDHLRATGKPEDLANALGLLQGALWNLLRFDEGWAAMDEAISVLEPLGPTETLATTLYRASHAHMLSRHAEPAFDLIGKAASMADIVDSDRARWLVGMMTGTIHLVIGDAERGAGLLQEAVTGAETMEQPHLLSIALGMLGSGGGEARLYETAIAALDRGIEQGLATDEDYGVAYDRAWLARIAFEQGRWDDAVALTELVDRSTTQRQGIAILTAMSALGRVRVRRGDPGALSLLEDMVELARSHELQHGWNAICGRAEHLWLGGRGGDALDELEPAYRRALDTDSTWARGEIGFWMWRVGAIDEPPEGAAEPFALQMSGDWEASARAWREIGCPYEVGMALADGNTESKIEALGIFDSFGARPVANLVRNQLRVLGVESIPRGPTRETQANPAGLTARQLEVLRLIVEGLGNEQIADSLYLSKKTVEHHVSAIYSKLGVTTRAQAIKVGADLGQT